MTLAIRMMSQLYVAAARKYLREPHMQHGPGHIWRLVPKQWQPPYARVINQLAEVATTVFITPGSPELPLDAVLSMWVAVRYVPYTTVAGLSFGPAANRRFYGIFHIFYPVEIKDGSGYDTG